MQLICGVIRPGGAPAEAGVLQAMAAALLSPGLTPGSALTNAVSRLAAAHGTSVILAGLGGV
jgi:hypothetical protein